MRGDLPLPRHRHSLRAIGLVTKALPLERWCLVGGMMVLIAARAAGHPLPPRSGQTTDADLVVDVCADPGVLGRLVHQLRQLGYDTPADSWSSPDIARCTFMGRHAQLDVLCPDDAEPAALDAAPGVRSLAIPR